MTVTGNAVLVTGAATGIGRATAELLARQGARVFGIGLDAAEAGGLAAAGVEFGAVDIRDDAAVRAAVATAAGVSTTSPVVPRTPRGLPLNSVASNYLPERQAADRSSALLPWFIAAVLALVHILTNGRYGFHRDELQFLSDARHLDWGFVAYPPLTAFVEHVSLALFGLSLVGLRRFSVLAQAAAVGVTGMMAGELGGGRKAQLMAALAVALSPLPLFEGTEFQYTTFDYLWWGLAAYFILRALRTENPRWWLAVGAVLGLGLLTKYAIVFYIAGILVGVVFTPARRWLRSGWFWAGSALAVLMFLPNLLWLVHHDFISYTFLQPRTRRGRGPC